MSAAIKLVVGLGNPGMGYAKTRHNAGFWFVEGLAKRNGGRFLPEAKFSSEIARLKIDDNDFRLVKPMTFMNDSGRSVRAIVDYYKFSGSEILIAHDEIDLDPGVVRIKKSGGHGGHNGLRDIISSLNSDDFLRLRIGVGHPGDRNQVTSYVLSRPGSEHGALINDAINYALDKIDLIIDGDYRKAMNELHGSKS